MTNILSKKRTIYLSVKDFAERLNITKSQVYNLINQGLPTFKVGNKCIRIPEEEAMNFLKQRFN